MNDKNILIVDDDAFTLRNLSLIFKQKGYTVETAGSGEEALTKADRQFFHAALLDVQLPDVDGVSLLAVLHARYPEMVAIISTGHASIETAIHALNQGASAYIIKPVNVDELLTILQQALEKQQLLAENKRLFTALQQELSERRRLSTTIEQSAETVIITDTAGTILYVNPAFEKNTGYSKQEAIGLNPRILKSGLHDNNFYAALWGTITAGKVWHGRMVNRKKDGTLYTEDSIISPVRDERGKIINFVALKRDITHELELEEQYRHAQKMEMVGQLTSGIAHDFNNLLTAINGFSELLQMRLPPDSPYLKLVANIANAGHRAANLISQLMLFSRKQMAEPQIIHLNTIVTEMNKMVQSIIGATIQQTTTLDPDLQPIKADPTGIEQILINLIVNARDAMPHGGTLTITTTNLVLPQPDPRHHPQVEAGCYVLLTVSDTGVGMSKAVQQRIFEPFFTTKEPGKGTGLGLSTVFAIVKQNNGYITVHSQQSHGTTFKIYLPWAEKAEQPLSAPAKNNEGAFMGTETILLAEDEQAVRELTANVLRDHGYTVLEATDEQQAIHIARNYNGEIHLLITDVIMPYADSQMLVNTLKTIRPHTRVIYISGYSNEFVMNHGVLDPATMLLQKPFSAKSLTQKVRHVLGSPSIAA